MMSPEALPRWYDRSADTPESIDPDELKRLRAMVDEAARRSASEAGEARDSE